MAELVLITGASSGLGAALAAHYATQGWQLALVARRAQAVEVAMNKYQVSPDKYKIYSADVSNQEAMQGMAQDCMVQQGLPDVVIANAGISVGIDCAQAEDLQWLARMMATNVLGLAYTLGPFISAMVERGSGTLVGIGSVAGIRGLPGHAGYCASKAAAISYCESLRGDLRPSGVKVVTICPGYVATAMTQGNQFYMPFLLQPETFAAKAFQAISAHCSYRVIPWPMALLAKLLRLLPNAWFDRLLANRARKPRATTH